MVICVVLLCLADHAAQTAHDRVLIDVCVMAHEEGVPSVIEQLAVHEVVTCCTNHKEAVADELDVSCFVAQLPVGDAVNCGRS